MRLVLKQLTKDRRLFAVLINGVSFKMQIERKIDAEKLFTQFT